MFSKFSRLIFVILLVFMAAVLVNAQSTARDASTASGKSSADEEDFPKGIKESLAKSRIENEKKEYEELLKRGEEAAKISAELEKSFSQNKKLSGEDQKKLDRLEKLAKKIRSELGGGDDGDSEKDEKPVSTGNALETLQSDSTTLLDELKKATRHTISVIAIQSSNSLIKVVKLLRFGKN